MDEYEEEYYKKLKKLEEFKNDLKAVIKNHKVILKRDVEMWHGGSKAVIRIFVDDWEWVGEDFDGILTNIGVLE